MSDGGKFIGITGILSVGLCIAGAAFFLAQEYFARLALPPEMQTPEMIQRHFDGEVALLSTTFAAVLIICALVLTVFFGACSALYEKRSRRNCKILAGE